MGLFDFFKGRGKKRARKAGMETDSDAPRCAHYIFSHVALRQFAFSSPYMCLGALGALKPGESGGLLDDILASVADYCQGEGEEKMLEASQLRLHSMRAKKSPCLIVEMPAPRAATEVYFIGIVLKPSAGDTAAALTEVEVRYFTLEYFAEVGSKQGVLCEWTADSKHINHGITTAADVKKFLAALEQKC